MLWAEDLGTDMLSVFRFTCVLCFRSEAHFGWQCAADGGWKCDLDLSCCCVCGVYVLFFPFCFVPYCVDTVDDLTIWTATKTQLFDTNDCWTTYQARRNSGRVVTGEIHYGG